MKWIQLLAFSFMLVMNYLANALPIQGKTTGELSAQYPNLFVPAGWAFSIWGIIYLLLGIWVAGALIYKGKEFSQPLAWLFIAGSLLNASWILAWHHEKTLLSLLIMLALLISLVLLVYTLGSTGDKLGKITFGIYLGWICVATVANATAWLVDINWGGAGISAQNWTLILIVTAAFITLFSMLRLQNPWLALSVAWAFFAIVSRQINSHPGIAVFAGVAAIGLMLAAIAMWAGWLGTRPG